MLVRSFVLEQDVAYGAPKVPPVSGAGVLVVGVDISFLRCLDIFQGNGGVLVVIERRKQAGLDADVKVLHGRRVQTEVLPAQWPHAHKLHLPREAQQESEEPFLYSNVIPAKKKTASPPAVFLTSPETPTLGI